MTGAWGRGWVETRRSSGRSRRTNYKINQILKVEHEEAFELMDVALRGKAGERCLTCLSLCLVEFKGRLGQR